MANSKVSEFILNHMKENGLYRQSLRVGDTVTYDHFSDKKKDINDLRGVLNKFYEFKEGPGATPLQTIFSITGLKEDYNKE